ncbi:LOW QUALITY PROTEIN: hypothetical protein U9M48_031295, partial [Paspalum notatum var. saurae]
MYMSTNPMLHHRPKHIKISLHFIPDKVALGDVKVHCIPLTSRYADIFTEGLPSPLFQKFKSSLHVQNYRVLQSTLTQSCLVFPNAPHYHSLASTLLCSILLYSLIWKLLMTFNRALSIMGFSFIGPPHRSEWSTLMLTGLAVLTHGNLPLAMAFFRRQSNLLVLQPTVSRSSAKAECRAGPTVLLNLASSASSSLISTRPSLGPPQSNVIISVQSISPPIQSKTSRLSTWRLTYISFVSMWPLDRLVSFMCSLQIVDIFTKVLPASVFMEFGSSLN